MQTAPLGPTGPAASRLIYGCMRTPGTWNPEQIDATRRSEAMACFDAAVEAGYTHFDHADIYAHGMAEALFGQWLAEHPDLRDKLTITTKCGIRFPGHPDADSPARRDFSHEHIIRSVETSLQHLGIERIDLLLLHRPDFLMHPPEVAAAFDQLRRQGKVASFGVSNFTIPQIDNLARALDMPLACNQIPLHVAAPGPIENGLIDGLMTRGITPTAYSPVAGGGLGDNDQHPKWQDLAEVRAALDREAEPLGVSRDVVALAWLLRHPAGIQPIVGSRRPERIKAMAAADAIELSREAWYRILIAGRGAKLP